MDAKSLGILGRGTLEIVKSLGILDIKNNIGLIQKQEVFDLIDLNKVKTPSITVAKNLTHPIFDSFKMKELDNIKIDQNLWF